jgi:hypothetical protein
MLKSRKKAKGKIRGVLRCFHCGGDMDGRRQSVLRYFLFEWGRLLYCDKCVDKHNEKVHATGQDQEITTPYVSDRVLEDAAMIRMARSPRRARINSDNCK